MRVVRLVVGCLSFCLIQWEHKEHVTVVCILETLKGFSGGFCGSKVSQQTVR